MKGFQLRLLPLLSLFLLLSACAYAVEVTARIKGTVTDPTGSRLAQRHGHGNQSGYRRGNYHNHVGQR